MPDDKIAALIQGYALLKVRFMKIPIWNWM
jgi:hypothetical protein